MRGEAKGIDVHLLMMECYQRLGWKNKTCTLLVVVVVVVVVGGQDIKYFPN